MTSARAIIGETMGFVKANAKTIPIWSACYLLTMVVMMLAMRPLFEAQIAAANAGPHPTLSPDAFRKMFAVIIAINIFMFLIAIVLITAAMRAALTPERGGIAFLRIGKDELRMIGLTLLLIITFYVASLVVMITAIIACAAVSVASKAAGIFLGVIIGICIAVGMIHAAIRVSISGPLTLLRAKITIKEAWRLTKGRTWLLFRAYFLLALIVFVMLMVIFAISLPFGFSSLPNAHDPNFAQRMAEFQRHQAAAFFGPGNILLMLLSGAFGGLMIALQGGALAIAAKTLLAEQEA